MDPNAAATDASTANSGNDFGLNAEEQAAFEQMRSDPGPTGEPGHVEPSLEPEPAAAAPAANGGAAPAAPAAGGADVAAAAAAGGEIDDDDGDDEPAALANGGKPPKRVSYNKFRRVEDQAKADRAELEAERAKTAKSAETQARLDERLRLINEALTPQPAAPVDEDPEPDPLVDIFGHNAWLKRQLVKVQAQSEERFGQIESSRQAETADQTLASTYMDDAARFAVTEPTFGPAYNYLMQVRTAQLANYHFGKDLTDPATAPLTVQEITKIKTEVAREEKQLVSQAIKAGRSPAAAVFAMAKMTGYRPQAAAAAPGAAAAAGGAAPVPGANGAGGNGAAAVAAAVAAAAPAAGNGAPKPSVAGEIARIKAGQEASLSLSHGGGAPAPVLSPEKLANMPEEEFGALLDQMTRGQLKSIMGGQ